MMFEVGKKYCIKMWEGGAIKEYWNVTVQEVAMPLVKFDNLSDKVSDDPVVVNTSSPAFVSAEEEEE